MFDRQIQSCITTSRQEQNVDIIPSLLLRYLPCHYSAGQLALVFTLEKAARGTLPGTDLAPSTILWVANYLRTSKAIFRPVPPLAPRVLRASLTGCKFAISVRSYTGRDISSHPGRVHPDCWLDPGPGKVSLRSWCGVHTCGTQSARSRKGLVPAKKYTHWTTYRNCYIKIRFFFFSFKWWSCFGVLLVAVRRRWCGFMIPGVPR